MLTSGVFGQLQLCGVIEIQLNNWASTLKGSFVLKFKKEEVKYVSKKLESI